jgi:hypothetical protein
MRTDAFSGKLIWDSTALTYRLPDDQGGFIHDFATQSDVCKNTEMREIQGLMLQWPDRTTFCESFYSKRARE